MGEDGQISVTPICVGGQETGVFDAILAKRTEGHFRDMQAVLWPQARDYIQNFMQVTVGRFSFSCRDIDILGRNEKSRNFFFSLCTVTIKSTIGPTKSMLKHKENVNGKIVDKDKNLRKRRRF